MTSIYGNAGQQMMSANTTYRILLIGLSDEAQQLQQLISCKKEIKLVAIHVFTQAERAQAQSLNIRVVENLAEIDLQQIDCAIVTAHPKLSFTQLDQMVCELLVQGIHVISTLAPQDPSISSRFMQQHQNDLNQGEISNSTIQKACEQGDASFHVTGIFPHLMLEQLALTLAHALSKVDCIQISQAIGLQAVDFNRQQFQRLGFGIELEQWQQGFEDREIIFQHALKNVLAVLHGQTILEHINIKTEIIPITAKKSFKFADLNIAKGTVVAVQFKQQVMLNDQVLLSAEEFWYLDQHDLDESTFDHPQGIYGQYQQAYNYTVQIHGEPSIIKAQLDFTVEQGKASPLAQISAQAILHAIPEVCAAQAGVLMHNAAPQYQLDHRIEQQSIDNTHSISKDVNEIKKVIIWGPGEIGGSVVRAALQRPNIKIVGAKVFSPHKHGQDLGTLVGIDPIGVKATNSTADLLALDADCVIVTPQPRSIVEGLDQQVIEILKSGKSVITSAAYHNVTMPNWLMNAQTPTVLLAEALATHGIAKNKQEEIALNVMKKIQKPLAKISAAKKLLPLLDQALKPVFDRVMPPRATAQQLMAACQQGHSALHGTGVHPTFMAERIGLLLANMLPKVKHMRFVEAADFSFMPDGMWGGLNTIGFGLPVAELDENFIVAKAGDFYYGDVTGNVGHLLFGYDNTQINVVRSFRAIPAQEDFKVGNTLIRKGHAAALHMTHKGYVGDHHFFTNEECWYLGPHYEYRGDALPYGNFETPISYTVQVSAEETKLNMQLSMDGSGEFAQMLQQADISTADLRCVLGQKIRDAGITNPITNATAMALLDAVPAVCNGKVGVMIDDIKPQLKMIV